MWVVNLVSQRWANFFASVGLMLLLLLPFTWLAHPVVVTGHPVQEDGEGASGWAMSSAAPPHSSSSVAPPPPPPPLFSDIYKQQSLRPSSLIGADEVSLAFVQQVAQSLRSCRLHAATLMRRKFVNNHTITCNDGSAAGYYIRKSQGSKRWVIFLEGGWYCYDRRSCFSRWHTLRNLMSSKSWPEIRNPGGIMSNDPQENRHWWNANHVYIPYCSSDFWSGSAFAENTGNFAFHGSLIVEEVVKDLLSQGMLSARRLLLAGSSAGGVGVLLNVDRVADQLHRAGCRAQLRGVSDSGWFLDNTPYAPVVCSSEEGAECVPSVEESVRRAALLWGGRLPEACVRQQPTGGFWKCYFGYRIYPTLKTGLFVFQWLFDEAQLTVNNVGAPFTKEQWDYIHRVGNHFRQTLQNVTAVFAPSCISHVVLTKRDWRMVKVNNTSLPDALNCWDQQYGLENVHRHMPRQSRHRTNHQHQQPVFTVNKNLLSNAPGGVTPSSHTFSHTPRAPANTASWFTNVTADESLTSVTSSSHRSRVGKKRKKNRRRHHNGHKRRRRRSSEPSEALDAAGDNAYSHSANDTTSPSHTSTHQQECNRFHHVDKCTWPQCNGACPKLLNPFTGEEMDFMELLKSFGLDMSSVALALGMELDALNAMGNDKLMQILTQHSRK